MSPRILIAIICLTVSWASSVNRVAAQPAGADKLVRVTYPIADLIVPVKNQSAFSDRADTKETSTDEVAAALIKRIANSVAKGSWEGAGGPGRMQFFPMGLALVVTQREDVQKEIAGLLAELRRLNDVQIATELRCVWVSPAMAKQIRARMDADGQAVRAENIEKPANAGRFVSVDDKQVHALLELAQSDRTAHIMQAPKLTLFNGQQAGVSGMVNGIGTRFDIWPTAAPDHKSVRFCLRLEDIAKSRKSTEAVGTFTVPANRTLLWQVSDGLFVLVTPRVIVVEEEKNLFLGNVPPIPGRGGAEEQSVPEPKKPAAGPSAKEKAIQDRLCKPISLSFNDAPLREAINAIAIQSGVEVVPDMRAFQDAKVSIDAPVSGSVDNINMKNALNILLRPMRLQWIIEDEVLKITTEERTMGAPIRITYNVRDLVDMPPAVAGQKPRNIGAELTELIQTTIAKSSWEQNGGRATIRFLAKEKKLVVTQNQETHEEIQLLLATLRKLQNPMVNIDMRFLQGAADASHRLLQEMKNNGESIEAYSAPAPPRSAFNMSDAELSKRKLQTPRELPHFVSMDSAGVERFLEAAKNLTATPAPKMHLYNGEHIDMSLLQKQTQINEFRVPARKAETDAPLRPRTRCEIDELEVRGGSATIVTKMDKTTGCWHYDLQPFVTPDRKSVRMSLAFHSSLNEGTIEQTTKAAATFIIPDQRTLVWHVGAAANGQHLFVLVTPRVIVREEEEEEVTPSSVLPIPGR
jgi:hypothetical protein